MRLRVIAFWLSLLLIFIIPWENGAVISGIGPVARWLGLMTTGFWLGVVFITGRFRRLHPFHILAMLFLLWNIGSLYWSIDSKLTLSRLETYVQLTILVFLIWDLYTTNSRIRTGLQVYVLGAYVTIWSVISNFLAGKTTGQSGRYSAFNFNENDMALILVIGMGMAWYLAISADTNDQKMWSTENLLRLANYIFVPLAFFSIILTASRTALLSTIPIVWFMLGSSTQLKPTARLVVSIGAVGGLLLLQPFVPQTSIDRLTTTSDELSEGDLNGRRQIWDVGIEAFLEHPIVGSGSGVFKTISGGKVAHNTYLSILAEMGIIGFLTFMGMVFMAVYQPKYKSKWLATFWLTVFLSWSIGVSAMNYELRKPTWLILALALASGHTYIRQQSMLKKEEKTKFKYSRQS